MRAWLTRRRTIAIAVAVLLVLGGGYLTGDYPYSPCRDTLAFSAPDAAMDVGYEPATGDIDVTYRSGGNLTADRTESLSVVIYDAESDASATYPLANSTGEFPIVPDSTFGVPNATVDDQSLTPGDEIVAVLHTQQTPLPPYCRNSRGDSSMRVGIGRMTVEQTRSA